MKLGQLASPDNRFCPLAAINKWPYRHLHGDQPEVVSTAYFANGKFRSRGWTIYYINTHLDDLEGKPLMLIPYNEVKALFKDIDDTLHIYCAFPNITRHPGFVVAFEEGPRPRYLGRLTDDISTLDLEAMVPAPRDEEPETFDDRSLPAFRRKMEAAIQAGKQAKKNTRERKRRERVVTKQGWCAQLRRAQCYLGLRPRGAASKDDRYHRDPNLTYEESLIAQEEYERAAGIKLPHLDTTKHAPYPFNQSVVFVCVDVEAYEKNNRVITEVGISTLDTLDIQGVAPGEGGAGWMSKIRARHFRIAEHGDYNNTEYVSGCADKFEERFGTSEWISIEEAPQVIASCFRHPFSASNQYLPYPFDRNRLGRHGSGRHGPESRHLPSVNDPDRKRNIVLVGHDIKADIDYMRTMGYDITNLSNLLEAIDTADMYRAMKHEPERRNLGAVLLTLDLVGWHLHNAGNDAGYTLEAFIGIAIIALEVKHESTPSLENLNAAAADAQARLIEDLEEWEIADEEGGDGGEAVKLLPYQQMKEQQETEQALRRANKAEDKRNVQYAKDRAMGGHGGRGRENARTPSQSSAFFSSMQQQPSMERKGEIKFHAANEQKLREMKSGDPGGSKKYKTADAGDGRKKHNSKAPVQDAKMAERLSRLDEDEYFMI